MSKVRIPEVRMTKTARMRLLKANPLVKYEIQKSNNTELARTLNLDMVSRINKTVLDKSEITLPDYKREETHNVKEEPKKRYQEPKKNGTNVQKAVLNKHQGNNTTKITKARNIRRSLSAQKIETTRKNRLDQKEILNTSISCENINFDGFKTPADKKYSLFSSTRKSLVFATPSAAPELKRRLAEWLAKRNKKFSAYKNLKCFGAHSIKVISEHNKENFNTSQIEEKGSYEDLKIDDADNCGKFLDETSLVFAPSDLLRVAKGALNDLNTLVSEGYPMEQCEDWLIVIRKKCPKVVEDPSYWECRATLEQLRGDIGSAVECYKTAVVQGAEVSSIEQSLGQLLEKFKLLDIDSSNTIASREPAKIDRSKIKQDFKNVFTSMLIKFAIQEKTLKSKSSKTQSNTELSAPEEPPKIIVTPVRRSARRNLSRYSSTPGVQIYSSMNEIDEEQRKQMIFQTNAAL